MTLTHTRLFFVPLALQVEACALPDNVVISSDGKKVYVACEGEPSDDHEDKGPIDATANPDGMIGVVDVTYNDDGTLKVRTFSREFGERLELVQLWCGI